MVHSLRISSWPRPSGYPGRGGGGWRPLPRYSQPGNGGIPGGGWLPGSPNLGGNDNAAGWWLIIDIGGLNCIMAAASEVSRGWLWWNSWLLLFLRSANAWWGQLAAFLASNNSTSSSSAEFFAICGEFGESGIVFKIEVLAVVAAMANNERLKSCCTAQCRQKLLKDAPNADRWYLIETLLICKLKNTKPRLYISQCTGTRFNILSC